MGNISGLSATQDSSDIPVISTDVTVNATGGNGATAVTIPALVGQTAYLSSFEVYSGGATAATISSITIVGLKGGTLTIPIALPAGVALAAPYTWVAYDIAIPASGPNVAIVLNIPAAGGGRTICAGTLRGFYL